MWCLLLFEWWDLNCADDDVSADMCLYVHTCGDFGAAGMPGCWHLFFEEGMLPMARHQGVLTRPMAVCVDDTALIGSHGEHAATDEEGIALSGWLAERGVFSKDLKVRAAASLQLCVGFWWDSVTHTRTLEERKLMQYMLMLSDFAKRRDLTLKEMQSASGRMQRAIMTLPPGAACLLANLFALMRGLSLPWHRRRTSAALRADFKTVEDLLELNSGKGYYRFDAFSTAPGVDTDASKSTCYAGGGYFSMCGRYRYWQYGRAAARQPIDFLEGDAVTVAAEDLGPGWRKCMVRFRVDNRAFQRSAVKGWSRAERLSLLLRKLFRLALSYECVYQFDWVASEDNIYGDPLSRPNGHALFLQRVKDYSPLPPGAVLRRDPRSGAIRRFGRAFSSDEDGDGPQARLGMFSAFTLLWLLLALSPASCARGGSHSRGGASQGASIVYSRASVYTALPEQLAAQVDELLDQRLSSSSLRSMHAALAHWDVVRARHGWERVLRSDHAERGARLVTLLLYLIYETDLVADSISNYIWALRAWNKLQRQLDPVYGVAEWEDLMAATAVVAWVASEPRKRVPVALVAAALATVDHSIFWEVQAAVLMLMLLYTYARSETPCPSSYSGAGAFDPQRHLRVSDVCVLAHPKPHARFRLKIIKQDQRMERAAAQAPEGDWVHVGAVADNNMNLLWWLRLLFALHGGARSPDAPFYVARDRMRAYRYADALADMRVLWARVCGREEAHTLGLHGLRVEGYNCTARVNRPLAVAQGGWEPTAQVNDRYDRFTPLEVLDIPSTITAQLQDGPQPDLEVIPEVEDASPPPTVAGVRPPSPRPPAVQARPLPADGGGRLGSARRRGAAPARASASALTSPRPAPVQGPPPRGQRIRVYWTDMDRWFEGAVTSRRQGETRVFYDAVDEWPPLAYWHNLAVERWQLI